MATKVLQDRDCGSYLVNFRAVRSLIAEQDNTPLLTIKASDLGVQS